MLELIVHFQTTRFEKKKKKPFKFDMTTIFVRRFVGVLEFFTILLPVQHLERHARVSGLGQHRQPDHRHMLCTVRRFRMGKFTNSTFNVDPWLILKTYRRRWRHSRVHRDVPRTFRTRDTKWAWTRRSCRRSKPTSSGRTKKRRTTAATSLRLTNKCQVCKYVRSWARL